MSQFQHQEIIVGDFVVFSFSDLSSIKGFKRGRISCVINKGRERDAVACNNKTDVQQMKSDAESDIFSICVCVSIKTTFR